MIATAVSMLVAHATWSESESPTRQAASSAEPSSDDEAKDIQTRSAATGMEPKPDDARDRYKGIEEILVTSRGRTQALQDVSVSVAAFDSEYMEALGAHSIADISQFTPNHEIRSVFSATNPTLFIRGVGLRDFNSNSSSSVAVYNDDVYMNSPAGQLSQLFDIEGVEVLRGPQGTLYGRNASAGAIIVRARKPTGTTNGYTRITYGKYNQAEVEAAVEVPILGDTLSIRIAGRMNKRDGTTLNRCGSRDSWGAASRSAPGVTAPAAINSFESRVYSLCFNEHTTAPVPVGGQGWYSGGLLPDPNYGTSNSIGKANLQRVTNQITPCPDCIFTGDASAARVPDVAEWVNNRDDWAVRSILRWQPTQKMDWQWNLHGGRAQPLARQFQTVFRRRAIRDTGEQPPGDNEGDLQGYNDPDNIIGCQLQLSSFCAKPLFGTIPEDGDPFAGDYNRTGKELLDLFGTSVIGEIDSGNWRYRTITAFEWNERAVDVNLDGSPFIGSESQLGNNAWQVSEEVRVLWDGGGSVTGQLGGFFLYEKLNVDNAFQLVGPEYLVENPIYLQGQPWVSIQDYEQGTYSASAYAFLTWEPYEFLRIEGGLRYNYDHKAMILETTIENAAERIPLPDVNSFRGSTSVSANGPSGDISISYMPTQNITTYLKYSRGFKGPHINGGAIGPTRTISLDDLIKPVKPETVDAIELGLKTLLFGGRMRWNSAAYYYDYNDLQVFQDKNVRGGVPIEWLVTADDADIYGIESEIDVRPLEGWAPEALETLQFFASFAFNKSEYTDFIDYRIFFFGPDIAISVPINNSGNTLINAPELAFSGFVQWKLPVSRYGFLTPRFDWSYKSKVYFNAQNRSDLSQKPIWLMNMRLGYTTPDGRIEVAGFILNVADTVYRLDGIDISIFQRSMVYAMGDPRTYGISFSYNF